MPSSSPSPLSGILNRPTSGIQLNKKAIIPRTREGIPRPYEIRALGDVVSELPDRLITISAAGSEGEDLGLREGTWRGGSAGEFAPGATFTVCPHCGHLAMRPSSWLGALSLPPQAGQTTVIAINCTLFTR